MATERHGVKFGLGLAVWDYTGEVVRLVSGGSEARPVPGEVWVYRAPAGWTLVEGSAEGSGRVACGVRGCGGRC